MMRRVTQLLEAGTKIVEVVLVLLLTGMSVMVFVNVVLRYGFNSGIVISEEMSRFFFVWLTFIGAVIAFKEHGHMGVETLVKMFGRRGRVICMGLSNALILGCVVILFWGAWLQAPINASVKAPVSGMPMILVYGISFFTAGCIAIIAAVRLARILAGRVTEREIAIFVGDYEAAEGVAGHGE
ncbi:MAG: TRAP transporter small permease [Rubellimicrobium sp.]|nr:TRAP transporter small permease [Rubellimicrobium sp.]